MKGDRGDGPDPGDQHRGISEIISVVLLFGLIVAGAALVAVTWTSAQATFAEQGQVESAEMAVQQFDQKLSDVTSDGAPKEASFDLTDRDGDGESVHLESTDSVTVELHDGSTYRPDCTTTLPLQKIVYDVDEETTVTYQAGGVFKTTGNRTTTVNEPDLGFSDGTVDLSLTKFKSDISNEEFDVSHDVDQSKTLTAKKKANLFGNSACQRPERVRVTVDTDKPDLWAKHLRDQTPDGVTVTVSGTAVAAEINDSMLVREADDDRNSVVNLSPGGVAGDVLPTSDGAKLWVDKGTDNEYTVSAQLLGTQYGDTNGKVTKTEKDITGRVWDSKDNESLDIVFLVDESGSMSGEIDNTKPPINQFLNEFPQKQDHRASVIGFSNSINRYEGLTDDRAALKSSVSKLNAGGGTPVAPAMANAINHLKKKSSSDRKQVIALMSDGHANNGYPAGMVKKAQNNGIKVYTIGFGSGADASTLGKVAANTGGRYAHISKAKYLDDSYKVIVNDLGYKVYTGVVGKQTVYNLNQTPKIVRKPVVLEHKLEGGTYEPVVSGTTPVQQAVNYQEYVTTVPSLPDGERMHLRAIMHDCTSKSQYKPASKSLPSNVSDLVHDTGSGPPTIKSKYKYDAYDEYRCDSAGPGNTPSTVGVYFDGDSVPPSSSPAWQADFDQMVAPYTDGGEFDLESNQVIVAYGDAHSSNELNSAVVLYRVGKPTSLSAKFAVDLNVDVVDPES